VVGLRTAGNRIVRDVHNDTGEAVLLRGVNRSGMEYRRDPIAADEIAAMVCGWGANIIRLPLNQEWVLTDPGYLISMDYFVETAASLGAYTLLDLHWLDTTLRQPPLPNQDSVTMWRVLARHYREQPAVLYDILNEPHVTMPEWQPWATRLIDAIRGENPPALIFVSGVDWGYDLSGFPLPGVQNVVYSTHVYPNKGADWDRAFGKLSASHPVFAGEWGGEDQDVAWGRMLASYFKHHGIGWTAWSWKDWPHLVQRPCEPPYEPTEFGKLVQELLGGT
jgi:endoglucanase